jgi:hypothetical protein
MNLDNGQALSCPTRLSGPPRSRAASPSHSVHAGAASPSVPTPSPGRAATLRARRRGGRRAPPRAGGIAPRRRLPHIAREAAPCVAVAVPGEDRPRGVLQSRGGCRISRAGRPASERRREMSRSEGFWKVAETNQSPGSGPLHAAVDICDSLHGRGQWRHRSCHVPDAGARAAPLARRRTLASSSQRERGGSAEARAC